MMNRSPFFSFLLLFVVCCCPLMAFGQSSPDSLHRHAEDSTDVFFRHLDLNEVVVTGVAGRTKLKYASAPVSLVSAPDLRATASTNVIDALSHQAGIAQLQTGSSISKPIIRGLGYNRVVVLSDGVRQEGQQWGDEHGVEVASAAVHSAEILKGPASLMYGSDAMAGVVILRSRPIQPEGTVEGSLLSEYHTNNGQAGYSLWLAGNQKGFVWDAQWSQKLAHAYKNRYDGYVPGSQAREQSARLMLGVNRYWGYSHLVASAYSLTPSIVEGERDELSGLLLSPSSHLKTYGHGLPFQRVDHYKLVWDHSLNLSSGYLKATVGYQQNGRKEYEESPIDYGLYLRLHTLTYDLRFQSEEQHGWRFATGIAGMWQRSDNRGEEYLIPDYRLFDAGVYLTASKSLRRLTLNGGLRLDRRGLHGYGLMEDNTWRFADFSRHFYGLTGSLGAVWNVTDRWNVRWNLARGFRSPNVSELASNGVHEGSIRYEVGNQRLKAEYSLQTDLGVDYASDYVSLQLALFANRISNFVFARRVAEIIDPDYSTFVYTQGDALLLGFEAGVDLHPIHSLHYENTFSYVNARLLHQPAESHFLPFTPAPRWTSELKWELSHHAHTTIAHRHSHHGTMHTHATAFALNNAYVAAGMDLYLRQSHIYRADNTETITPSYALIRLSAGADVVVKQRKVAELYLTVDNLLDRAYQNHLSRLKYADWNMATMRQGVFNMGRNISLKLIVPLRIK